MENKDIKLNNNEKVNANSDFVSLYTKLYKENFKELEALRKKERNVGLIIFAFIFIIFACIFAIPILLPFVVIGIVIFVIVFVVRTFKANVYSLDENGQPRVIEKKKTYKSVFKENIIIPIIKNTIPTCEYIWYKGISEFEYSRGDWERYDVYSSEDQLIVPINVSNYEETKSNLVMSEVHTQDRREDSEGHTQYVTLFHGLAGSVDLPKTIDCYIKVTRDKLKLFGGSKDRLNMDMSEFEKIFDVETDDKIKAMQILTADVMTDMINLIETSNIKFEFHIKNDKMYIRFHTGELFEPDVFGKSMQLDMLKKYCDISKNTIRIVEDICNKVMSVEL